MFFLVFQRRGGRHNRVFENRDNAWPRHPLRLSPRAAEKQDGEGGRFVTIYSTDTDAFGRSECIKVLKDQGLKTFRVVRVFRGSPILVLVLDLELHPGRSRGTFELDELC